MAHDEKATLEAHFVSLARNNLWSNHRLHRACWQLSRVEYVAPRASYFGSIHATLNHILIVDLVYLGRLAGETRVPPDCEELHGELRSLTARQLEVDRELIGVCESQDAASLSASVSYQRSDGPVCTERVATVLTHLFLHQVHHRGQVHDMLSQTSVAPPQLDEFFLDGDLPLRVDELAELGLPGE